MNKEVVPQLIVEALQFNKNFSWQKNNIGISFVYQNKIHATFLKKLLLTFFPKVFRNFHNPKEISKMFSQVLKKKQFSVFLQSSSGFFQFICFYPFRSITRQVWNGIYQKHFQFIKCGFNENNAWGRNSNAAYFSRRILHYAERIGIQTRFE